MMHWINIIIQGVLTGGLYALMAVGLSLSFGIMRLVNIAHGDLTVLAAFLAVSLGLWLGCRARSYFIVAGSADGRRRLWAAAGLIQPGCWEMIFCLLYW
ncbi:ABC transporter permease subunit [Castellaniella sp.]|uniref:ABC transporter permease subunit n=1 Tax=Castellaniella sp. TaxID=1955812 RepID=UPI002AFFB82F|nr:hypothetical protein [Castellaniella sp.]